MPCCCAAAAGEGSHVRPWRRPSAVGEHHKTLQSDCRCLPRDRTLWKMVWMPAEVVRHRRASSSSLVGTWACCRCQHHSSHKLLCNEAARL